MNAATIIDISTRPFLIDPSIINVESTYEGTRIPLDGLVTLEMTTEFIRATLVNSSDWSMRMMLSMPSEQTVGIGGFFRDITPGHLLNESRSGTIRPELGDWIANGVVNVSQGPGDNPNEDKFQFQIQTLTIASQLKQPPIAATRLIFSGAEIDVRSTFTGRRLIAASLTKDALQFRDEITGVTVDGELDALDQDILWNLLSFVSGNRLNSVAIEHYDEAGALIRIIHRRGAGVGGSRSKAFHDYYAPLTPMSLASLANGFSRLMRAAKPFPIEIVIFHLLDGSTRNIETDAQHYVLAIHAAFEAWNRKYGRENLLNDKNWERIAKAIRKSVPSEVWDLIPEPERDSLKSNVAADLNHSNRTTMGWRQTSMFSALGIDVSDSDNKRALGIRNELLHNGYFLRRWRQLSPEAAQERWDDVQRLKRLTLLIVFRLAGFEGTFLSPMRLKPESLSPVELPPDIGLPSYGDDPWQAG